MWKKGYAIKTKKSRSCCHVYRGPSFLRHSVHHCAVVTIKMHRPVIKHRPTVWLDHILSVNSCCFSLGLFYKLLCLTYLYVFQFSTFFTAKFVH